MAISEAVNCGEEDKHKGNNTRKMAVRRGRGGLSLLVFSKENQIATVKVNRSLAIRLRESSGIPQVQ